MADEKEGSVRFMVVENDLKKGTATARLERDTGRLVATWDGLLLQS